MFKKLDTQNNQPNIQTKYLQKFGADCLEKMDEIALKFNHFQGIMNEPMEIFLPKIQSIVNTYEIISYEIYDSCEACGYPQLGHAIVKMNIQMHSVIKWILTNLTRKNRKSKKSGIFTEKGFTPKSSFFNNSIPDTFYRNKEIKLHEMKALAKNIDNQILAQDSNCIEEEQITEHHLKNHKQDKENVMNVNSSDARILISESLNYFQKKCEITERFVSLKQNYLNDPNYIDNLLVMKHPHFLHTQIEDKNEQKIKKLKKIAGKFINEVYVRSYPVLREELCDKGIQTKLNEGEKDDKKQDKSTISKQINLLKKELQTQQTNKKKIQEDFKVLREKYNKQQFYVNYLKNKVKIDKTPENESKTKNDHLATKTVTFEEKEGIQTALIRTSNNSEDEEFTNLQIPDFAEINEGIGSGSKGKKRWSNLSKTRKQNMFQKKRQKTWIPKNIENQTKVDPVRKSRMKQLTEEVDQKQNSPAQSELEIVSGLVKLSFPSNQIIKPTHKLATATPLSLIINTPNIEVGCLEFYPADATQKSLNLKFKNGSPQSYSNNSPNTINSFKLIEYSEREQSLVGKSIKKLAQDCIKKVSKEGSYKMIQEATPILTSRHKQNKYSIIKFEQCDLKKSSSSNFSIKNQMKTLRKNSQILESKQVSSNQPIANISEKTHKNAIYYIPVFFSEESSNLMSSLHKLTNRFAEINRNPHVSLLKIEPDESVLVDIFLQKRNAENLEYMFLSEIYCQKKKRNIQLMGAPLSMRQHYKEEEKQNSRVCYRELKKSSLMITKRLNNSNKQKNTFRQTHKLSQLIYKKLLYLKNTFKSRKEIFLCYWFFLKYPFSSVVRKNSKQWKNALMGLNTESEMLEMEIDLGMVNKIVSRIVNIHEGCVKECEIREEGEMESKFCVHLGTLGAYFGLDVVYQWKKSE